jgi:hypothetical protein
VNRFAALIAALSDASVDFVLIGGLAATVHGSARLTQDIDILYARSDENLQRLVDALAPLSPYLRGVPPGLPFDWSVDTLRRGLNFTLITSLGALDCLGEVPGLGTRDAVSASQTVMISLFERNVCCLDLPTLIHAKRAAGRPKDLEAIAELEAIERERDAG